MTNSRKRTFVFLAIVFALFLCFAISMIYNSTNTVKAEEKSSEQQTLFIDGINSGYSNSSEMDIYNAYSDFTATQEETSYTIQIFRDEYIDLVLYNGIDVSNWQKNVDYSKVKSNGIDIPVLITIC